MTQVHFTLKSEEIQSIIEYSVKDDVSKNILTTVFNQLMENKFPPSSFDLKSLLFKGRGVTVVTSALLL